MGQKVHPIGFRLGIYRGHDARWYAPTRLYGASVIEDLSVIRPFITKWVGRAEIASIEIEKAADTVRVIINPGKPGMIIGKGGQGINELRAALAKKLGRQGVDVSVQEVKRPELNASLVAQNIASQLERRASYKRAMKRATMSAMRSGARGINICCSGRLGGAEIAREHWTREGSVPRQTLLSDVDFALAEAKTTYGIIGVKVWICRGTFQSMKRI